MEYLWCMKHFIFLFSSLFCLSANAQELLTASAQGMGGQSVFFQGDDALFGNPAGLSKLDDWSATAVYERRFLLADLNFMGVATGLPTRSGTFGLSVQRFGFDEFYHQKAGLAYARNLTDKLLLGGQVNVYHTQIEEYGNETAINFEIGLQAQVTEELMVGTHVLNPAPAEYYGGEKLPAIFRVGASYLPSKSVTVGFELEKDVDFPMRVKAGLAYQPVSILQIMAGYSSNPGQFHFGFGLQLGESLLLSTAARYHQTLGITPSIGLTYQASK